MSLTTRRDSRLGRSQLHLRLQRKKLWLKCLATENELNKAPLVNVMEGYEATETTLLKNTKKWENVPNTLCERPRKLQRFDKGRGEITHRLVFSLSEMETISEF